MNPHGRFAPGPAPEPQSKSQGMPEVLYRFFLHKAVSQQPFHIDAFTHRRFYTQNVFPHRCLCTQEFLHWAIFTHRRFYTRMIVQFKTPAADAVCVNVVSDLTYCAHSSLQSFSASAKNWWRGPKQTRQEGPLSILRGPLLDPIWNTFALREDLKMGPQHSASGASLGACLTPHPNALFDRVVRI